MNNGKGAPPFLHATCCEINFRISLTKVERENSLGTAAGKQLETFVSQIEIVSIGIQNHCLSGIGDLSPNFSLIIGNRMIRPEVERGSDACHCRIYKKNHSNGQ